MGLNELFIPAGKTTPEVNFSVEKGELKIAGRSLPQDAYGFFKPITDWMQKFINNPSGPVKFSLDLEYLDSTSSKQVFNLLQMAAELKMKGFLTSITWIHEESDELMLFRGKEMARLSRVEMDYEAKEDGDDDDDYFIPK